MPEYTSRVWLEEFALVRVLTHNGEFDAMYNDDSWWTDNGRLDHRDVLGWRPRSRSVADWSIDFVMWLAWPMWALLKHMTRKRLH